MCGQGCAGKTASVLPACKNCTNMSKAPQSMLRAAVSVVASLVLPCSWACLTHRRLHRIVCTARRQSALTACLSMSQPTFRNSRRVMTPCTARAATHRVEPFEHQSSDCDNTQVQDVGPSHDVLARPCLRVTAKSSCRAVMFVASSVSIGRKCQD